MAITTTYRLTERVTDTTANTITSGSQETPDLHGLSNGGWVVAYRTDVLFGDDYMALDFYDASGNVINTAQLPAVGSSDAQDTPEVTQLSNGNVLVVWDDNADGANGIRGRIYTSEGVAVSATDLNLSGGALSDSFQYPDVTALEGGGFVVTYSDSSSSDAFAEIYDNAGVQQGTTIALENLSGNQEAGAVTALADGGFAVTFTSDTVQGDLYTRTYDADGTARTANPVLLDSTGANVQPDIAALNNGNYVVVYNDTGLLAELGQSAVAMHIVDANGSPVGEPMVVNSSPILLSVLTPEADPSVTVLESGHIVVTWTLSLLGLLGHQIRARIFEADGTPVELDGSTDEFVLNDSVSADTESDVAALLGGGFVSAWEQSSGDGSGSQITQTVQELSRVMTSDGEGDVMMGDVLDDIMYGGGGDDTLISGGGRDELYGGDGNDDLVYFNDEIDVGQEIADGGDGIDWLEVAGTADGDFDFQGSSLTNIEGLRSRSDAGVSRTILFTADQFGPGLMAQDLMVDANATTGSDDLIIVDLGSEANFSAAGWTFTGWEDGTDILRLNGNGQNNIIMGSTQCDEIFGGAGVDTLLGLAGNDQIFGGDDADDVNGGDGSDSLFGGNGDDNLFGQNGDDTLEGGAGVDMLGGGEGNDLINGGEGNDMIFGQGDNDTLNGEAGEDTITGGAGDDTINGGDDDDFISGEVGNDLLFGGLGNDIVTGQAGNDTLYGEDGIDMLNAGGGNDVIYGGLHVDTINGGNGLDLAYGGTGDDTVSGGAGDDELHGDDGADIIFGNTGGDMLFGGADDDAVYGQAGFDTLFGGAANDALFGGGGGDEMYGGAGDDVLCGDTGNDLLWGDTGADIFVMNQGFETDRINDFEDGVDLIDFSENGLANDFASVIADAFQLGTTVRIELNPNNILVIENFNLADLDASDFIF